MNNYKSVLEGEEAHSYEKGKVPAYSLKMITLPPPIWCDNSPQGRVQAWDLPIFVLLTETKGCSAWALRERLLKGWSAWVLQKEETEGK